MMLSVFPCVWPSVRLLWRNVCLGLPPIFWSGYFFEMEMHELFVYLEINPLLVALLNSIFQGMYIIICVYMYISVQFSCSVMFDPLQPRDCSTPGFPVHHQLPEFTQTHVHRIGDAIQPSHPLLSPSPPALNLSQHQGLFKWVSSSHQVARVLEFQLQHQSFQWIFRTDFI